MISGARSPAIDDGQNIIHIHPPVEGRITHEGELVIVIGAIAKRVTRAKEETPEHGTTDGIVRAVSATGAVITSAGIVLAAVFCVLGVLPLIVLTQVGIIVGLGILLDTFVVRTVVIPALFTLIGPRIWWPAAVGARPRHRKAGSVV